MEYIAYYRVSTKKQSLGLDAQQDIISTYVSHNGGIIVMEFQEKESGKDVHGESRLSNRPVLIAALNECKRIGATLIVAKVDRLTRDIEDGAHIYKNYSVRFCDHPDITPLELGIFLGMAQQEREFISQRTKQGMAKSTKRAGNPNLTIKTSEGLALIERNHQLIKENRKARADRATANVKAYAAIRYLKGTLRDKAFYLNKNGFVTTINKQWYPTSVSRLIARYS
ncbi:MAG: resolvase [bacterium P3]|nr:MAG: resolvase [bacterium P3]KWW40523.1 MAG: resolvase [bacterium F083]